MLGSLSRRPAVQSEPDQMTAVGAGFDLAIPARSCRCTEERVATQGLNQAGPQGHLGTNNYW
jgi:hypothetical protein